MGQTRRMGPGQAVAGAAVLLVLLVVVPATASPAPIAATTATSIAGAAATTATTSTATPATATATTAPTAAVSFAVDATAQRTPISPLIYGLNDSTADASFPQTLSTVRPTLVRQGGNSWTPYNWVNNATNGGSDWCFENYGQISRSTTPAAGVVPTVQADQAAGVTSLVTIPITGYVAADEDADQHADECDQADERDDPNNIMNTANYVATRLDVNGPTDPGPLSDPPSLADGHVYQDQFVHRLAQLVPGAKVMFSLDNEPDDWRCTHPEVWPPQTVPTSGGCADPYDGNVQDQEGTGVGYASFMARELAYATAIKRVDPRATVIGPVLGGYSGLLQLQGADPTDRTTYGDFVDYFLQQVHAADLAAGKTLIDDFDFHWYPQMPGVDSTDTSAATVAAREQAPRSLWDPTYIENSWITQCCTSGAIDLLPWLDAKIRAENPGMPLSVSEWQYGAGGDISGAIADADALGIFGRYGVHDATYWPDASTTFAHGAFEIYRNYDGHGASFGNTEVQATDSDPAMTSVYASIDRADPDRVVIVAINKHLTATTAHLTLRHAAASDHAAVYTLTGRSATPQPAPALRADGPDTFAYTMPAQSVSVIVPAPATSPVFVDEAPPASAPTGIPYAYTFDAAANPAPTYAVASGTLPAGLTLTPTGVLAGTPTEVGTSTFTVSAANGTAPAAVTPALTVTIHPPSAPVFTADHPPGTARALSDYAYTFTATGSPVPTFSVGQGALPAGLSLSADGRLSGRLTTPGSFSFTVRAANGVVPAAVTPSLSVVVAPPPSGTVVSWGNGADGQLGDGSTANHVTGSPVALPAGTDITQVAGGTDGGVALSANGTVYTWGSNDQGQLGDGMAEPWRAAPRRVAFPVGTPPVAQVAEGDGFVAVRTTDGNVWEWGANWTGQIGNGNTDGAGVTTPVEVPLGTEAGQVTALSAGVNWVEALTASHDLLAWGGNVSGQLGTGSASDTGTYTPVPVALGSYAGHITAVSANSYGYTGGGHTLALTDAGAVLAWGNNPNGELGDGTTTDSTIPVLVSPPAGASTLPRITAISAGYYANLALTTTGAVLSWGANWADQLGTGTSVADSDVPVSVAAPTGMAALPAVQAISANGNQNEILTTDGAAYSWGTSATTVGGVTTDYSLGSGTTTPENLPTLVTLPAGTTVRAIDAGETFAMAVVGPAAAPAH